jgi:hypothetical protein
MVMRSDDPTNLKTGFCIFIDTLFQGGVTCVSDAEHYIVFDSEMEAQREIADNMMTRIQQFLDGERDFEDALTVEEYVLPVTVNPDGVIADEYGNRFDSVVK